MRSISIDEEKILNTICKVLTEKFNLAFELNDEIMTISLFERPFLLSAIQLYQLLMILEEKFCVYFTAEEIRKNGFFTIEEILKLFQFVNNKRNIMHKK